MSSTHAAAGILVFSEDVLKYLGGSGGELGNNIAVDSQGNAYLTGYTLSADFPITAGALQTKCKVRASGECSGEAFVTKLDPSGSALVFSTYLGGTADDYGQGIALDRFGNIYISVYTDSLDLPTTTGAFQKTCNTNLALCDGAFVAKLNPIGSALIYATYLGGRGSAQYSQQGYSIAVDLAGDAYVAGITDAPDFPTTPGAFQTACKPGSSAECTSEAFVVKLNAAGSALIYSTYLGGSDFDLANHLALDCAGNVYVTGYTASVDFPATVGAFQTACNLSTSGICSDAFVTRLNRTGSALVYSTYLGGSGDDVAQGIAVSPSGKAYVTGGTNSSDFPTMKAFQPAFGGGFVDAFVTKLSASGGRLVYSSYLGGTGDEFSNSVAVHGSSAYLTGFTNSTDFPTICPIQPTFGEGDLDGFVVKIGPAHHKRNMTQESEDTDDE